MEGEEEEKKGKKRNWKLKKLRKSFATTSTRFFATAPGAEKLLSEEQVEEEGGEVRPRVTSTLSAVNLTVDFESKKMVAVVGMVASGKSTLLRGLLGHLPLVQGELRCTHSTSYVPQKPFVLSGNILDNILMGDKLDEKRLEFAIRVSDFASDIAQFQKGLKTSIGERGQTLSGGQKQRLAICRAIYKDPELLVCDDPLAAVDARVGNVIFGEILDMVHSNPRKSCLMALNQLHFLPKFDWIIVMKHGMVVEQGTYDDIKDLPNGVLQALLRDQPTNDEIEAEEKPPVAPLLKAVTNEAASFYVPSKALPLSEDKKNEEEDEEELVAAEKGERGTGFCKVLGEYLTRMGRIQIPLSLLFGFIAYALMAFNDISLAFWIQAAKTLTYQENMNRAFQYLGVAMGSVLFVEILSLWDMRGSLKASTKLYDDIVERLLHAPISFYESTPSGRIASRLSGDLNVVDRQLQFVFDDIFQFSFVLAATTITAAIIVVPVLAFMVLSIFLFSIQLVFIDRTNRESKRFTNQALSPILTNVSETVNARQIIQTMGYENFFLKRHCQAVNEYNRPALLSSSVVNMGSLLTGVIAFVVSMGSAFLVVSLRASLDPSLVGLALVYAQTQPYFLGILSGVLPIGLSCMTSLERILEFSSDFVPSERPWHVPGADKPNWPENGDIEFENSVLIYRPGLPPSLRSISFKINHGEVVGIVGRTGAGKSSILIALLRIHELSSGRILINDVDCAGVGIQTLRNSIIVIPQEPVLLQGTVLFNLDPFNAYTQEEVTKIAKRVGLDEHSLSKSSAEQLSAGERQLVQMARAILRKKSCHIIVLDEPTSNIDSTTDKVLEMIVKQEFVGKTRLVIAHRLSTVINSDKIVVMKSGTVAEFGSPQELLQKQDGLFFDMMKAYRLTTQN